MIFAIKRYHYGSGIVHLRASILILRSHCVSPSAVENLVLGIDSPHAGFADGNLLQLAIDVFPASAAWGFLGDALADEGVVVGVDPPHVALGTYADVFQKPVHPLPARAVGTVESNRFSLKTGHMKAF